MNSSYTNMLRISIIILFFNNSLTICILNIPYTISFQISIFSTFQLILKFLTMFLIDPNLYNAYLIVHT